MIFMHIRCKNRNEENPGCDSHENLDPEAFCGDTKSALSDGYDELKESAVESGWVMYKREWYCSSCVKYLGLVKA